MVKQLEKPDSMKSAEAVVYDFLTRSIRGMSVRRFSRYMTGAPIIPYRKISIAFNAEKAGLKGALLSHMCDYALELPNSTPLLKASKENSKEYCLVMNSTGLLICCC